MTVIIGILILLNAVFDAVSWVVFIGVILVLLGLMKMFMPYCPHCEMKWKADWKGTGMEAKTRPRRRR